LDACVFDGLGGGVQVGLESLGPFFGVEAGGEDVGGVVVEVQVEVDVGAVVGAAAAHTRTGLSGGTAGLAGLGVVVVFVVDDEGFAGSGFGDGPAGGVEASVVEAAQQDQVLSDSGPAVGPVPDVVSLGPLHRASASGPGASVGLLELELPAQRSVGQAQGASEFDGFAGAVVEH